MKKILFVCTGNICRSPMAAGYFRYLLHQANVQGIEVESAGTHATPGGVTTPEAALVCKEHGFDISDHRATFLTPEIVKQADLICVMEAAHRSIVLLFDAKSHAKTDLLTAWLKSKNRGKDIPDPFLRPLKAYFETMKLIEECSLGLFQELFPGNS